MDIDKDNKISYDMLLSDSEDEDIVLKVSAKKTFQVFLRSHCNQFLFVKLTWIPPVVAIAS